MKVELLITTGWSSILVKISLIRHAKTFVPLKNYALIKQVLLKKNIVSLEN